MPRPNPLLQAFRNGQSLILALHDGQATKCLAFHVKATPPGDRGVLEHRGKVKGSGLLTWTAHVTQQFRYRITGQEVTLKVGCGDVQFHTARCGRYQRFQPAGLPFCGPKTPVCGQLRLVGQDQHRIRLSRGLTVYKSMAACRQDIPHKAEGIPWGACSSIMTLRYRKARHGPKIDPPAQKAAQQLPAFLAKRRRIWWMDVPDEGKKPFRRCVPWRVEHDRKHPGAGRITRFRREDGRKENVQWDFALQGIELSVEGPVVNGKFQPASGPNPRYCLQLDRITGQYVEANGERWYVDGRACRRDLHKLTRRPRSRP